MKNDKLNRSAIYCLFICISLNSCNYQVKKGNKEGKRQLYFKEATIKQKVDSVLRLMTLEEKIGQLVLFSSNWDKTGPSMPQDYLEEIKLGRCGNLFNAYTTDFTRKLQKIAVEETRLGIPLLFGYDVIHGHKTIFPIPLGEAATWDMEFIEKAARIAAIEASASGLHWTFAPVADISRDPRWGRISEGAGEDAHLSSRVVQAKVKGFQGNDLSSSNTMLACLKHFAAYGAPIAGRDYNTVDMSYKVLIEEYLPPYKAAVDVGVATVMTSFNELFGIPATSNKRLLTDILRDNWNFNGFVVTDYTAIMELKNHGVAVNSKDASEMSFRAGVDMDMQSGYFNKNLVKLVEDKKISESLIDQSVARVLGMKFRLGLFDNPYKYCDAEREKAEIYTDDHLAFAREYARKSFVLLKNKNSTLPLSTDKKVAIIGPLANSKRDLLGSWCAVGEWKSIPTVLEAFEEKIGKSNILYSKGCEITGNKKSLFGDAIKKAAKSDIIIAVMGESWDMSGEAASRSNINIPGVQTDLLKELRKLGKPIILVLMNGRPLVLKEEVNIADAILETWFPGTEGARAIIDVVYGKYSPSGKLPVTFPRSIGQVPIYYNHKNTGRPININEKYTSKYLDIENTPLFPFGYGLSYTTFEYENLKLANSIIKKSDAIKLSVQVKNTGDFDGEEVVQVYIRDIVGSTTRPVKELKAFRKIFIKKGESTILKFTITPDQLYYLQSDYSWGVEEGEFKIFVGTDSENMLFENFWIVN